MAPPPTDTIRDEGGPGSGAPRRPLQALAYIGCVDSPDPQAPRLVWLEDVQRVTVQRPTSLWTLPDNRRDEVQVQVRGHLRVLVRDRHVSAAHATLVRKGASWSVHDEGSLNGTRVNVQTVTDQPIVHGDVIEMGRTFWRFIEYVPMQPSLFERRDHAEFGPSRTIAPQMHEILALLSLHGSGSEHVLILGESGVGKEIAARRIHALSGRRGAFHAVNCANLQRETAAGHLFGWAKGAFTGAVRDHAGYIEAADGGTLVLDEVGTLSLEVQAMLLRVVENAEVERLGDTRGRPVDLRIVACTNSDIPEMVRRGTFREDLYARLATHITTFPPLRDRPEDIGGLVAQFLKASGADLGIQPQAMRRLLAYGWPQNVRQLRNVIHEAVPLARQAGVVAPEHLALPDEGGPYQEPAPPFRAGVPPEHADRCARLEELLRRHRGNVSAVARELGVVRERVYRDLRRCRLEPKSFR